MVACPTCVKISELTKDLSAVRLGFEEMNAQVEEIKKRIAKAPAQYPSTRYLCSCSMR
jgi:hypothetical protein